MRVHIDDLNENGLNLVFEEDPLSFPALGEMAAKNECAFLKSIDVRVFLRQIGDLIEGDGRFDTQIRLTCNRCLEPFEVPLASDFNLTYVRQQPEGPNSNRHGEVEITDDEIGLIPIQGDELDLRDAIQEEIVMALPMRALCRPDCKGLCSHCGTDLNQGGCRCEKRSLDPRFDALKHLKIVKR